jgi:hypothetical protein
VDDAKYVSASGVRWSPYLALAGRARDANIFRSRVGFRPGLHPVTRTESLEVFFEKCWNITVRFTNLQGKFSTLQLCKVLGSQSLFFAATSYFSGRRLAAAQDRTWKTTSREEIMAFFGLHVMSGVLKAAHRDTREPCP